MRQFGKLRQAGGVRKGCDSTPPACSWTPAGLFPTGRADYSPQGRGTWGHRATAYKASGPDQAEKELGGPGKLPSQRPALSDPGCPLCLPPARTCKEPSAQPASRELVHLVPFSHLFIHSTNLYWASATHPSRSWGFQAAHPCYSGVGLITIRLHTPWARRQDE